MKNEADERTGWRRMAAKGAGKKWILALLLLAAALGVWAFFHFRSPAPGGVAGGGNRPQPVSVAEVRIADMPIWISALGTAVPRNLVTVRSRVDGELIKLHFREGQMVTQGQALADRDPRPFQVQLTQASGQLAKDAALLKNARLDLERYKELWAKDSIPKQQLDTQEALVGQYEGTVEADRGAVESARLQLAFAHIVAPASGRIGRRQVDPGNQIHASDANGLAVIAQLQPITLVFSVPESYLPALNRRIAGGDPVAVEAWDREQKERLAVGHLLTTDNLVDTATGTIKMKAEFANEDSALFPNQFVNVRLLLGTRKDALIVPGAALQRGAKGTFVYVVDGAGTVASVPVAAGPADGELLAVDGALAAGARVVTDGADKLRDGAKVEAVSPATRAAAAPPAAAHGKHRADGKPPAHPPRGEGGAAN